MLRDGTLLDYVNRWSQKYPQELINRLHLTQKVRNECNCQLKEALSIMNSYMMEDAIVFEIGSDVQIRKINGDLTLFTRYYDRWEKGKMEWLMSIRNAFRLFSGRNYPKRAIRKAQKIEFGPF